MQSTYSSALARLISSSTGARLNTLPVRYCLRGNGRFYSNSSRFNASNQKSARHGGRYRASAVIALCLSAVSYFIGSKVIWKDNNTSSSALKSRSPHHNIMASNLKAAADEIRDLVGNEHVSTQEAELAGHSSSEWSSHRSKNTEQPYLVVYPSTTDEVSLIMKVCHRRAIPVTAFSGGTSLEGHFAATRGGICIDFARMDKILITHPRDLDVVVQPGVGWEELNEHLSEQGLFFPPDPGPGAKIGGMVGTGCSGTNAYCYGTMREWVLSLTVVLADGTIIRTRQRPRKSSAGYDLTKIIIGSEGTLGLVTEAVLRVTVRPKNERVAVATFDSIYDAAECVSEVVAEGVSLAGIEILDDMQMRCINQSKATTRTWDEKPTLFFKFAGTKLNVKEQIAIVKQVSSRTKGRSFKFAHDDNEARELWSARKEALWSVLAMKRDENDQIWTTDVAVPITHLADIITLTKEDIRASGLLGTIVGHVGDGNFHAFLLFNESERSKAENLVHRMVERAIDMEGTVSGEHGVGLVKRDYLSRELGQDTVDVMRMLKKAFDPFCLLNCDKIIRDREPSLDHQHS